MRLLCILVSVIPSILFLIYAYKKDRVDKEPTALIILLVIGGALSCFPASLIEGALIGANDSFIGLFGQYDAATGETVLSAPIYHLYLIVENFLLVALVEEACKFVVLYRVTAKNKNFNSLFDGLIYAVAVGIGFEILENILYASNGFGTALMRASMPGHFFFAIFSGYFYSQYHMHKNAQLTESALRNGGVLAGGASRFNPRRYILLALLVPTLIHGTWDYLCTVGSTITVILFFAMVIALYIVCFARIRAVSKADSHEYYTTMELLNYQYPGLPQDAVNAAYYSVKFGNYR